VATNIAGDHRKEFEVTVHGTLKKWWVQYIWNYPGLYSSSNSDGS
jgi:hypothetical protein